VTTFYAFGDSKLKGSGALEEPFDFQPSMNLEDVHRGIIEHEPAANSYPSPSRKASGASIRSLREQASTRDSAGSLLRRPSIGKFMASQNREARAAREAEAEAKEPTSRRRQSNISSLTGATPSSSKYRTSAGTIEPASSVQGPRRQPSGASAPPVPPKYHRAGGYSENATEAGVKVSASTRSSKAKSLQPPPRQSHGLTLNTSTTLTPDQYRSAGLPSPRSPNAKKTTTPSSTASRRISTIPHASGLAARTISPTDARRLKRLSMMNTPPPPALPPPVDTSRSMPGSPMIPTKSATPSSQGTTPEPQRKSYSSGLSMSSTSTARTSVGSLQPKLALNLGSRLPRPPQLERDDEDIPPVPPLPKNLASPADIHPGDSSHLPSYDNTPVGTYKSTNSSLYGPRKSSFAPDNGDSTEPETQSLESDHTPSSDSPMSRTKSSSSSFAPRKSSLAPTQCEPCEEPEMFDLENFEPIHLEARDSPKPERAKSERDSRRKRGMTIGGLGAGGQAFQMLESKASSSSLRKKDLAPIRLPPLNLLPLSTPTIARVNAFGATSDSEGLTPPPQKGDKVPSTPMTAAPSKASFFARRDPDGRSSNYERSMSSFNHPLPNPAPADDSPSSLSLRAGSSASSSIPVSTGSRIGRQTASPYVSGSLTRGTSAAGSEKGTLSKRTTPVQSRVKSRARKSQDSLKNATPLEDVTESPSTSTSASIRRKLSLSWKKTSQGKNSHAANERAEEYGSLSNSTTTNMPPKLPSSSTWSAGMTAPDPPPTKTSSSHLTSQGRRKSSIGNTPVTTQHDRNKSDSSWSSPKKEKKPEEKAAPKTASAASSILSPMSKMLGSKGSLSQLRGSRTQPSHHNTDPNMDHDDLLAEEEMRRIAARKKNLDQAATQMDDLKRRAFSKDRMSPQQVLRMGVLNIFEKGEIVDYKDVYFTGTKDAKKHVGDLKNTNLPNFGYDDERGDYAIVKGDHLAYRYEIIDVLGKGSFGQVVRCIDHRSGGLVAIKIIRNKKRFHQQALVEVNILQKLKEWVSSLRLLVNTS
jgi:dual specificity tyrosine-phosphorylation-regulated kinase 2/3/4